LITEKSTLADRFMQNLNNIKNDEIRKKVLIIGMRRRKI
jgi:hypothetical protein